MPKNTFMKGKNGATDGFTLLEVMLAMAILALVAAGVTQNLLLTRGISESNIRDSTAMTAASGYLEQIKAMEYERILASVRDPSTPLPTVLNQGDPDPIPLNQWTTKMIVIDEDIASGIERTMPFHIRVGIDDLAGSGDGSLLGVSVFFAWEDAKTGRRHERALRTMRSYVPNF